MFRGEEILTELTRLGITHVPWVPDSTLGPWEEALSTADNVRLIRVCREAEAWSIAAGLYLGGAKPLVVMQCTGLFDSGDALRNALFDYGLPLFALIGHRSALLPQATDSAKTFTEPILRAWGIDYRSIWAPEQLPVLAEHYWRCQERGVPGVVLLAEGRL